MMDAPLQKPTTAGEIRNLEQISRRVRARMVEIVHKSETMHLGGSLSCADILVALYWGAMRVDPANPRDPERDRFILSKGHAAPALFAVLDEKGFFPPGMLETYCTDGGRLAEHPTYGVPGVEVATGSLGHGLQVGLGMAFAGKLRGSSHRVYAVVSDAECNEGSTWEAALVAPAKGLDNVCAIVDFNKWQATDRSTEVTALRPLKAKWEAFGWSAQEVDGHDMAALVRVLRNVPDGSGRPVAVVANTVKGKGVSFMEDDNNWHYRSPSRDEFARAMQELRNP